MEERPIHLAVLKLGTFPLQNFTDRNKRVYALLEWVSQARHILDCDIAEYQSMDDNFALKLRFRSGAIREFVPADPGIQFVFQEVLEDPRRQDAEIFMIVPAIAVARDV